jgi:hypothetical protein
VSKSKGAKKGVKGQVKVKVKVKGKQPKSKCCVSSSKCSRCPLRMLKEGTLPAGYTVRKRKLVRTDKIAA